MKSLVGSKTFWINLGSLVVLILGSAEFKAVLPQDNASAAAIVGGVLAVVNIALRFLTSTNISSILPQK